MGAEGRQGRVVDLRPPPERAHGGATHEDLVPLVLPVSRHGVVEVQHEERGGGGWAQRRVGSGPPREPQDAQDLLLHLLLLAAAELAEAGVHGGLGLLAPQGEAEQEQQGGGGPLHLAAKPGEVAGGHVSSAVFCSSQTALTSLGCV